MNKKADGLAARRNLFSIRPDPNQPRSLLPPDLVGLFENGLMTPEMIISEWQKEPNQAFEGITKLADSIAQHGLINPISVQPAPPNSLPGIKYLIVTGERRWWAHVLLWTQGRDINEGDTRYPANQIKVNLTAKGVSIRAHQLIENVVREDINAVEKAHGMWALRYELSNKNYSSVIPTPAQEKYLVDWSQVEKSLSVSNRYRQYVISVLKLTPDALRLIQQHGLSESTIRPITQKLHKHPDLQMQALRQLIAWQESEGKHSLVREVKSLVDELVSQIPKKSEIPPKATAFGRPSLLPLEMKDTKKRPKAQNAIKRTTAEEVIPPGRADANNEPPIDPPARAKESAPIIDLAGPRIPAYDAPAQSALGGQNQTLLKMRPAIKQPKLRRPDLKRLTDALNQINPNDPDHLKDLLDMKEELQTLKSKIDHLLSYI